MNATLTAPNGSSSTAKRPTSGMSIGGFAIVPPFDFAAFAAASAVSAETSHWYPAATYFVIGPILYGGATAVGLSRMYHNKHWASDVVLGAAIGTFSGWKTVQYSHAHPTPIDKALLHVGIVPTPSGDWALAWSANIP